MNNNNVYSLNNFDFLARSFARMQAEGVLLISGGNRQYGRGAPRLVLQALRALLPAGDSGEKVRIRTLMQASFTGAGHYSDLYERAVRPVHVFTLVDRLAGWRAQVLLLQACRELPVR